MRFHVGIGIEIAVAAPSCGPVRRSADRGCGSQIVELGTEVGHVVVIGDGIFETSDFGELYGLVKSDLRLRCFNGKRGIPRPAVRAIEAAAKRMRMAECGVDHSGVRNAEHELVESDAW